MLVCKSLHQTCIDWLVMQAMPKEVALMILVFWIIAPTIDQISDIAIVTKLMRGPTDDLTVSGGKHFRKKV